jgi:hypothetical protein
MAAWFSPHSGGSVMFDQLRRPPVGWVTFTRFQRWLRSRGSGPPANARRRAGQHGTGRSTGHHPDSGRAIHAAGESLHLRPAARSAFTERRIVVHHNDTCRQRRRNRRPPCSPGRRRSYDQGYPGYFVPSHTSRLPFTIRSGVPRWRDCAIRTVPLTVSIILIHWSPSYRNATVLHPAEPHSLED